MANSLLFYTYFMYINSNSKHDLLFHPFRIKYHHVNLNNSSGHDSIFQTLMNVLAVILERITAVIG